MKKITILCLFLLFGINTLKAQTGTAPYSNLTTTCGASTSTTINYAVNTANYTGPATLTIEYDPNVISTLYLNGSVTGISQGPTTSLGNGNKQTVININITQLTAGNTSFNQSFSVQFTFKCPQTCFGQNLSTNIRSVLSVPGCADIVNNCSKTYTVTNTWAGENGNVLANNLNKYMSYDCILNRVTMYISVGGSACHLLNNGKITLTPSIPNSSIIQVNSIFGSNTPISITPVGGNSFSFPVGNNGPNTLNTFVYVVQLPCTARFPDVLNVSGMLGGDNCGNFNNNIFTYPQATFNLPNYSLPNVPSSSSAGFVSGNVVHNLNGTYTSNVTVKNFGSTPVDILLTTVFPNKKITTINKSTTSAATVSMNLYGCSANIVNTFTTFPQSVTVNTSKSITNIHNLLPNETINFSYIFDDLPGCTAQASGFGFNHSLTYTGFLDPAATTCNCNPGTGSGTATFSYIPLSPLIQCYYNNGSNEIRTDPATSSTGKYCTSIINYNWNSIPLNNPVIEIPISPYATLNTVYFNGVPYTPTLNNAGTHYIISPTTAIAVGQQVEICYAITYGNNIPEGYQSIFYPIVVKGNNNYSATIYCGINFNASGSGSATLIKEVWDNETGTFKQNGGGMPGVPTKYRFTINNTNGNRAVTNFKIGDRMPHIGDKEAKNCTPRNSQFTITPTNNITPVAPVTGIIPMSFTNSAVGNISLTNSFPIPITGASCANNTAIPSSVVNNTIIVDYPYQVPPFSSQSFIVDVIIPANATPGNVASNTASYTFDYKTQNGSLLPGGFNESEPANYTILPPPCDNCEGLLSTSDLTLNSNTTTNANIDYVIQKGTVTFTISKPIQELHLSLVDLEYTWDKKGCTNCKAQAITRGCLFPNSPTQTIGTIGSNNGYLIFNDFDGNGDISNATNTHCTKELIYKLGVMLQPGTYTIPFQVTLPKSTIPDCCNLTLKKFNIKLSIKDKDCKVCDKVVTINTDNCCTGSKWITKQFTAPTIKTPDWTVLLDSASSLGLNKIKTATYEERKRIEGYKLLKLINDKDVLTEYNGSVFHPIPVDINCTDKPTEYTLIEGSTRIFSATYQCNTAIRGCTSSVLVTIKTLNGNFISVNNVPSPVTQLFSSPGEYLVTYTALCGGSPCGQSCSFKIKVEKDCCSSIIKNKNTEIITNGLFGSNVSTQLSSAIPPHLSSFGNATVKLNYSCPTGCPPTYEWKRIRNNVVIETHTSTSNILSIPPPQSGEDKIQVTVFCGNTKCNSTVQTFFLGCKICSIVIGSPKTKENK